MSITSPRLRKSNHTVVLVWYLLIFLLSSCYLSLLAYAATWPPSNYFADTSASYPWYIGSLAIALILSIAVLIVKQRTMRNKLASLYTVAIIFTTVVGPTFISNGFANLLLWLMIFISIGIMWIFVSNSDAASVTTAKTAQPTQKK